MVDHVRPWSDIVEDGQENVGGRVLGESLMGWGADWRGRLKGDKCGGEVGGLRCGRGCGGWLCGTSGITGMACLRSCGRILCCAVCCGDPWAMGYLCGCWSFGLVLEHELRPE